MTTMTIEDINSHNPYKTKKVEEGRYFVGKDGRGYLYRYNFYYLDKGDFKDSKVWVGTHLIYYPSNNTSVVLTTEDYVKHLNEQHATLQEGMPIKYLYFAYSVEVKSRLDKLKQSNNKYDE